MPAFRSHGCTLIPWQRTACLLVFGYPSIATSLFGEHNGLARNGNSIGLVSEWLNWFQPGPLCCALEQDPYYSQWPSLALCSLGRARVPPRGQYGDILLNRTEYKILCKSVVMGSEPVLNMHGCTIINYCCPQKSGLYIYLANNV